MLADNETGDEPWQQEATGPVNRQCRANGMRCGWGGGGIAPIVPATWPSAGSLVALALNLGSEPKKRLIVHTIYFIMSSSISEKFPRRSGERVRLGLLVFKVGLKPFCRSQAKVSTLCRPRPGIGVGIVFKVKYTFNYFVEARLRLSYNRALDQA